MRMVDAGAGATQSQGSTGGGENLGLFAGGGGGGGTGSSTQAPQGEGNKGGTTAAGTGATQTTWRDGLPDDLKNDASLATFTDVAALAKSFISTKAMVGKDKVALPGKHATEADWKDFFTRIGKPETIDKYEIKAAEGANEGLMKAFKEVAFNSNLLPQQAQAVVDWYNKTNSEASTEAQTAYNNALQDGYKALRQEYGDAFNRKLELARIAATDFMDAEDQKFMVQSGLDKHPQMLRILAKVGEALKEDKIPEGDPRFGGKTPNEIQTEINSIQADRKHPYHVADHPNHAKAVEDMQALFQAITQASVNAAS